MYRIKTEKEFIDEFGSNWFELNAFNYEFFSINQMKEKGFLGKILTEEEEKEMLVLYDDDSVFTILPSDIVKIE